MKKVAQEVNLRISSVTIMVTESREGGGIGWGFGGTAGAVA